MFFKKKKAKKEAGTEAFLRDLRVCAKQFGGREAVFLNIMVDKKSVRLMSVVDDEGDVIFDGEKNIRKDKPTYLG